MIVKNYPEIINNRVLKNGTSWNFRKGFISDKTKSGKVKRRIANSMERQVYTLSINFPYEEYIIFNKWYEEELKNGVYPFYFDDIEKIESEKQVYQFTDDGCPQISNRYGNILSISMKWEKIKC